MRHRSGPDLYSDELTDDVENGYGRFVAATLTKPGKSKAGRSSRTREDSGKRKSAAAVNNNSSSGDDPYYCGLRARVPNFSKQKADKATRRSQPRAPPPSRSVPNLQALAAQPPPHYSPAARGPPQLPGAAPPFWWHSRLYPDAPGPGMGGEREREALPAKDED